MQTNWTWKQYLQYLVRWQLSTPILAGVILVMQGYDTLTSTIIANLIGGLIFFWVDMKIFKQKKKEEPIFIGCDMAKGAFCYTSYTEVKKNGERKRDTL